MQNNSRYDTISSENYSLPVVPKIPLNDIGGENMEWQHEYIKNLNDDVREIRSETQKMRQDFHSELNSLRKEINQTLDSKIGSFLNEMRDRDNQRHAEMLSMQNNIAGLRTEMSSTRKWIIGLVVAGSISFLGIAVSVSFGVLNVVNIVNNIIGK